MLETDPLNTLPPWLHLAILGGCMALTILSTYGVVVLWKEAWARLNKLLRLINRQDN